MIFSNPEGGLFSSDIIFARRTKVCFVINATRRTKGVPHLTLENTQSIERVGCGGELQWVDVDVCNMHCGSTKVGYCVCIIASQFQHVRNGRVRYAL